jgi:anti-sigma B factor antagonist
VTIQTRIVGSATVMELHGELTSNDGDPGLRVAVRTAVENGARVIILNLRDVKDIDSFGVAVLASSHMSAVNRGGRVMMAELSRKLKHLFALTRLDTVFEMYDTEADAVADCRATD